MSDSPNITRKLAAIMFTDIAGYTALSSKDENKALNLLDKQKQILAPIIEKYNGTLHKEIGDGLLFTFLTVTEAVKCGIKIQEKTKAVDDLNLRIGIHEGEITLKDGDALGDDVNIASRIEPFSAIGGVAISGKVQQNISSLPEYETELIGTPKLKGVEQEVMVYCIISHNLPKTDKSQISAKLEIKKSSLFKKVIYPITGLILTLLGIGFWFIYPFISIGMSDDREYDASIAILYMENISSEENSFFADGLTEELINRLNRIQNLRVRPRTDVAVYKNKTMTISEIANELQVNYIVEGAVRIIGEDLRVNAQLIDVIENKTVWSESYNNKLVNIFDVQDGIAEQIVYQLDKTLNISTIDLTATKRKSTHNLEAYNLVMQAFKHINNPIYTNNKRGEIIEPLAHEAIKLDSTYADAYAISSLSKIFKWMGVPTKDNPELREKEIKDISEANLHVKIALQYDESNLLALAVKTFLPLFTGYEEFEANKIFILRTMMIDAKYLLQKYPDNIFSKFIYANILLIKTKIQNGAKEDYQESLDRMLEIYKQFKKNNFVLSHPTEGIALSSLFENIPQIYILMDNGQKALDFIKENKQHLCGNDTYDCLNASILEQIGNGFYHTFDYENALFIINLIISQSDEDLVYAGNTINVKKIPYYRMGMIYMKWGQYDKAIEGFTQALKFSSEIDNEWWNAHFFRRLGLVYYYKRDYKKSSEYFLQAYRSNKEIEEDVPAIKSLCFNAYIEQLLGNTKSAEEGIIECSEWVSNNHGKLNDDADAYETYWPLYHYYFQMNNMTKAEIYLDLAYAIIGAEKIKKYYKNPEKDTDPKLFYCRDIIIAYEKHF